MDSAVLSLTMVPVAESSAMVAPVGEESLTKKFSSISTTVSALTATETVLVVSPAAKFSVVVADRVVVGRGDGGAVDCRHCTDEVPEIFPERVTVNVAAAVPDAGSTTDTSLTAREVSSLTMVPMAWLRARTAPAGDDEPDVVGLVGLPDGVAVDRHRHGLGGLAGGEAHRAEAHGYVVGPGAWPCR